MYVFFAFYLIIIVLKVILYKAPQLIPPPPRPSPLLSTMDIQILLLRVQCIKCKSSSLLFVCLSKISSDFWSL